MNAETAHIWQQRPIIISGPCSAETEEQLLDTARQLKRLGKIDALRAGVWKPRTRPGMFEGIGAPALAWLASAKRETGLPFCLEVAKAEHVELSLKAGADILWIGARSTVNPFSVQELADAMRGIDTPVFVKNPVNADVELWSGAIERLQQAGVKNIGMIHRGFSYFGNTEYRNPPMWELPIEIKRRFPQLPLLCDPSHISGKRSLLKRVAQKSIDLDFDGLMIESHPDPDRAWSDAAQQLTPQALGELLDHLIWRGNPEPEISGLSELRDKIDRIDDELLALLGQRMVYADQIGAFKKRHNLTILQAERWNEILMRAVKKSNDLVLSKKFMVRYFDAVHMESIDHQNKVMNAAADNTDEKT